MTPPKIDVKEPKLPIDAIRPPEERTRRPLGRASLISGGTTSVGKRKAAYTIKSSLLGG